MAFCLNLHSQEDHRQIYVFVSVSVKIQEGSWIFDIDRLGIVDCR